MASFENNNGVLTPISTNVKFRNMSQEEFVTQEELEQRLAEKQSIYDYPTYMLEEKNNVLAKLQNLYSTNDRLVIGFSTDQHIEEGKPYSYTEELPAIRTMRDLTKEFPFTMCILGGDGTQEQLSIPKAQDDVIKLTQSLEGANCPIVHLVGNHEGRGNITSITASQVFFSHTTDAQRNHVVTCKDMSNNCYYDDIATQVRIIMICDTNLTNYGNEKSKAFLLDALENLPDGYAALIFSHHPMGNLPDDTGTRENDWNDPLNWGNDIAPYKDKIIACICGHVHCDKSTILDDILYLSTTCAGNRELNDGSTRIQGQADFTAYDVFVVDRGHYKIECIRYGNGQDRSITYYVPTYTNALATAIDSDGTIYNGVGYKGGYHLKSNGSIEQVGIGLQEMVGLSGFIPLHSNTTYRFRNTHLESFGNNVVSRMCVYNSDFTPYGYASYVRQMVADIQGGSTALGYFNSCKVDINGDVIELTTRESSSAEGKYFRFNGGTLDDTSVVTINEEIPVK